MVTRKASLVNNEVYHAYTKSIAGFNIFRSDFDYKRMANIMNYYTTINPSHKFSDFLELFEGSKCKVLNKINNSVKLVNILAYCIMPTHIHLILQQNVDKGISKYMNLILKSYSRYFNVKYERLGPLWQGRFKNVLVETDEQLLHLTRYLHLNPVSSSIVKKPIDWKYSSYNEYLQNLEQNNCICNYSNFIEIKPDKYAEFVTENIDYQKELQKIKHLILE